MRQKDAQVMAQVLGRELRYATDIEIPGLETALGVVREHMIHVHPGFDVAAFDAAVQRALDGYAFHPLTDLRAFRERIEASQREHKPFSDDPIAMEDFNYEFGGCACFTPDDYEKDEIENPTGSVSLGMPTVRGQST